MRKLLFAVAVLLALLVVADRVSVRVADRVLADQLTGELGSRPDVDVRGFPFLTQAVAGRYDDLRLHADTVQRSGITVRDVAARLSGAQVPFDAALAGDVRTVPVQRLAVSGLVDYAELSRLAGRGLTLAAAPDGGVRVSGSLRVAGRQVDDASAVAVVQLADGVLTLSAGDVRVAGVAPPRALADALTGALGVRVRLPTLPYDVALSHVAAGADGVRITGEARDTVLRR